MKAVACWKFWGESYGLNNQWYIVWVTKNGEHIAGYSHPDQDGPYMKITLELFDTEWIEYDKVFKHYNTNWQKVGQYIKDGIIQPILGESPFKQSAPNNKQNACTCSSWNIMNFGCSSANGKACANRR